MRHGHGGGERVHVEEVDGLGDLVLDDHAPRIAVDEVGGPRPHLVGHEQDRVVVAEPGDRDLADLAGILRQADGLVDDPRRAVAAADVGEADAAPVGLGTRAERGHDPLRASAQGEEGDALPVDLGQVRPGGEAAVEDQLARQAAGLLEPVRDEVEDGVVLAVLADGGVGRSRTRGPRRRGRGRREPRSGGASAWRRSASRSAPGRHGRGLCGSRGRTRAPGTQALVADGMVPRAHQRGKPRAGRPACCIR